MAEPEEMKCLSPLAWRLGWLKSLIVAASVVCVMVAFQAHKRGYDVALAAVIAGVIAFVGAFFWPSTVTLLEDGLSFKRYGFTKFIPYSSIRNTESLQRLGAGTAKKRKNETTWNIYCALRLHLADGTTFDIGTGSEDLKLNSQAIRNWTIGEYGEFGAFNRTCWNLKRELDARLGIVPEPTTPMAEALMRGEKSTADWLAAIDAAAPANGDAYRGAEGAREALWRVLEDEASPREARAGAALALRAHLDDEGKNRMRVVVDSCESPKLRVAIETALDVGTTETEGEPRLLHALEQASWPREES